MWFGVDLRTNTKKDIMCLKGIELCTQNMLIILGPIVNMIWETCVTTY